MRSLPSPATARRLFLVFHLDDQIYGLPVARVREILPMMEITPVPGAPPIITGVINLRGSIIPIINLRHKLGRPERRADLRTCLVVADSPAGSWGFIADRVTDCLEIEEIEGASEPGVEKFLQGAGEHKGRIVLLLDPERILSEYDLQALKAI